MGEVAFTAAVHSWLEIVKAKHSSSLIAHSVAAEQIKSAIDCGENQVDILLAPSVDFLSEARERQAFTHSIIDKSCKPSRKEILFAKLFKTGPIEVKIDESKVRNSAVTSLLADLRNQFPGLNISLRGRFTNKSGASAPELFLRLEIKDKDSAVFAVPNTIGSGDGIAPEKPISRKQALVDARIESARKLGLPDDADPQWQEREKELAKMAKEFLEYLDEELSKPCLVNGFGSDCFKLCQVNDRFSKYEVNPFFVLKYGPAMAFSLYACANFDKMGVFLALCVIVPAYLVCFTMPFGFETAFKPADPLNTIQSPSIRKLIEEIRRRGLVPKLKQSREGYQEYDMHKMYVYDIEAHIE